MREKIVIRDNSYFMVNRKKGVYRFYFYSEGEKKMMQFYSNCHRDFRRRLFRWEYLLSGDYAEKRFLNAVLKSLKIKNLRELPEYIERSII
jgi:hypothetical protein